VAAIVLDQCAAEIRARSRHGLVAQSETEHRFFEDR
jgi:hypothetical protein